MKNINYNPYQVYHPYNSPQQQHHLSQHQQQPQQTHHHQTHHHQAYNQYHTQSHLLPTLQQPTQPNYQQQHQQSQQLKAISLPTTRSTATNAPLNSQTNMSSLTSAAANLLQNPYNRNYTNCNNHLPFLMNANNNNNNLPHYRHQQQHVQPPQLAGPLAIPPSHNQQQQQLQLQLQQQQQQQHHQQQHQQQAQSIESAPNAASASGGGDKFTMDACEIANFLANELFMQQLVSVDGIQSGVPTLTTSTLTPTTLRSIEESFIQLTSEPINAPYQAGFIPPPLAPQFPTETTIANTTVFNDSIQDYNTTIDSESEDSQGSWNAPILNDDNSLASTESSSAATDSTSFQNGLNGMGNNSLANSNASSTNDFTAVSIALAAANAAKNGILIATSNNNNITSNSATNKTPTTRRNQGGRRPNKSTNMSPEEEAKRSLRRERNKLAAARCRKRRVDQTNELLIEVGELERKREVLQKDIEKLNSTKQELEYILEAHRPTCQKIRQDLMTVNTYGGLIAPTSTATSSGTITGLDSTLASTGRSDSPLDLKPILHDNVMVQHIKNEPLEALDSSSSLDHDGPPSPKRMLLSSKNPMIPPPLPNVATLSPSLAAASASLNTPIMTTAPVSFGSFGSNNATLNTLNALNRQPNGSKQRPNTLPSIPRNLGHLRVDGKPPTDINGVAIQTPSAGMFNFDSLMEGGTGLTPVSGPLVPTCSSQNKHPMELVTPTSEPSKLVSL